MSYFIQNGDTFTPTPGKDSIHDTLPVGNYVPVQTMMGMHYAAVPRFTHTTKIYGNLEPLTERILNTFIERERATGVLLAGEKGSGKSLLARNISIKGYERGLPTILINRAWAGDEFASLLADVETPAIVQMDEFEKVYDREEQEQILTLLDGSMTTKKLFILTVNDQFRVDSHMKNRPGRLYYAINFSGLQSEFIREYCDDNLKDTTHTDAIVRISSLFDAFNFDMLKAIVEEVNRYGEDPFDAMELLNAKPIQFETSGTVYDVQVWNPQGVEMVLYTGEEHQFTPLTARNGRMGIHVANPPKGKRKKDEDDDDFDLDFNAIIVETSHIQKVDGDKGIYEFLSNGHRVVFSRKQVPVKDWRSLAEY